MTDSLQRLTGVNRDDTRIGGGELKIAGAGAIKEVERLLLDAIEFTACARAFKPDARVDIQIERQVRCEIAEHSMTQRSQQLAIDTAPAALIGLR